MLPSVSTVDNICTSKLTRTYKRAVAVNILKWYFVTETQSLTKTKWNVVGLRSGVRSQPLLVGRKIRPAE